MGDSGRGGRKVWRRIGLLAAGWLVLVGLLSWFLADAAELVAAPLAARPTAQRLAGWLVYAVPYLLVAAVFWSADRRRLAGRAFHAGRAWLLAVVITVSTVPAFATFGNRTGMTAEELDALRIVGDDFAVGLLAGRVGFVLLVPLYVVGLLLGSRWLVARGADAGRAIFLVPAVALGLVTALTLVAALTISR